MNYFPLLLVSLLLQTSPNDLFDNSQECLDYDEYTKLCDTRGKVVYSAGAPQYYDNDNNLLPWYTKPFLDVLQTWDIHDWDVFEWGAGHSTVWYAMRCKSVTSIESNRNWVREIYSLLKQKELTNVMIKYRSLQDYKAYSQAINDDNKLYDCIIIDGFYRNSCAQYVLDHIKPGGIIILDNANQKSIGINSTPTFNILKKYPHFSYHQKTDSAYSDWYTDYWVIQ